MVSSKRTRLTLIAGIGHDELYKMGFDGASIGQLRKLTSKQYKRLLEILEEFQTKEKNDRNNSGKRQRPRDDE